MSIPFLVWTIFTFSVLIWYLWLTLEVAFKGFGDIKHMLRELSKKNDEEDFPFIKNNTDENEKSI